MHTNERRPPDAGAALPDPEGSVSLAATCKAYDNDFASSTTAPHLTMGAHDVG